MTTTDKEASDLYATLVAFGRRRRRLSLDAAHDAASEALLVALENKNLKTGFAISVLHMRQLRRYRDERRHKTGSIEAVREEAMVLLAAIPPGQILHLLAMECAIAIERLPEISRVVMRLTALEWTVEEISRLLNLKVASVYSYRRDGRRLLRDRDAYEIERKRGHHQFIGIRKSGQKWQARFDGINLGQFATASQAAHAYDHEAKRKNGPAARLNFPSEKGERPEADNAA